VHYYQFNIGDYHSHTAHLEPMEDLAYRRMIDYCYLNEIALPADIDEIARLVRMRSHTDCIANVLREFFVLGEDGYSQSRVTDDLNKYREKSAKAKKSADTRWHKDTSKLAGLADAIALRADSERNANHKPITNNHKPITINQLDQPAADHELLFNQFWFAGMSKTNKKKAAALFGRVLSKQSNPGEFTAMLCSDIKNRLAANQLGFAEMHPTTYLNGERWNDQQPAHRPAEKSSLIGMLTDRSWADGFIDLNHEGIEHEH
jgi:uncharacterized protein YdaU (DUF1376 family)